MLSHPDAVAPARQADILNPPRDEGMTSQSDKAVSSAGRVGYDGKPQSGKSCLSREPCMAIYLVPDQKGEDRIAVDKAVVFIGRHPGCDVVLDSSSKVSRKHCCIALVNDRLVVRDLGSMNGVRVNGRHIETETTIQIGDEISIGDMRYRLQEESAPPKSGGRSRNTRAPDAGDEQSAGGRARREKRPRIDLSREFPVAIPEDSDEFDERSDSEIFNLAKPT